MQHRYLPVTEEDRKEMLEAIGVSHVDDLFADIPEEVRDDLTIHAVDTIDEVLRYALEPENVIDAVATPQVWAAENNPSGEHPQQ